MIIWAFSLETMKVYSFHPFVLCFDMQNDYCIYIRKKKIKWECKLSLVFSKGTHA